MTFSVYLHPKAKESLDSLSTSSRKRMLEQLKELRTNPVKGKRLKIGEFHSIRIGHFRAIYEIDRQKKRVIVLHIGHRRNVYEDFTRWMGLGL